MAFGLNDNAVKRIAAVAYHAKDGSMHSNLSNIYSNITHPDHINSITNAHTLDAMQHKFKSKDEENIFKRHLASSAAMNRGTLVPSDMTPIETGSEQP